MAGGVLDLCDDGGIDGVHQPVEDLAGGAHQHREDRDRDDQADDRVGAIEAAHTPTAPRATASEVNPSVRAW